MKLWKGRGQQPLARSAFGVAVRVELEDPSLRGLVEEIMPPGGTPCDPSDATGRFSLVASGPDTYAVIVGDAPWIEHATIDVALDVLDAQLRMFIAANATDLIFVHAGVVAVGGRAVVIPGESFSGKTTLVRALVESGATYFSDEYAVLDADGNVHPYARRLSIRGDGAATEERPVSELGGVAAEDRAEVGTVLMTRYRAGAQWVPTRVSAGHGVVALLANTVPAQERPRESLQALGRAIRGATILEGDRGEAGEVASQLLGAAAPRAR